MSRGAWPAGNRSRIRTHRARAVSANEAGASRSRGAKRSLNYVTHHRCQCLGVLVRVYPSCPFEVWFPIRAHHSPYFFSKDTFTLVYLLKLCVGGRHLHHISINTLNSARSSVPEAEADCCAFVVWRVDLPAAPLNVRVHSWAKQLEDTSST